MKITYEQILNIMQVLSGTPQHPGLASRPGLAVVEGFVPLKHAVKALSERLESFHAGREKLLESFDSPEEATKDEDFQKEWRKLLDTTVQVEIDKIPITAFAGCQPTPSYAELDALGPLLES